MENLILRKIDYLLDLADQYEASAQPLELDISNIKFDTTKYNVELYSELESSVKSLVIKLYEESHPYYKRLETSLTCLSGTEEAKGVLKAIKKEIEDGFILSKRDLISAEIFTDFVEMAEYLLKEKYKDAAAVIVGSVLEERLRQLATANGLSVMDDKGRSKKASVLNDELYKSDKYNKLDHKHVTAWLGLRNEAAHGHYTEYSQQQVESMLDAVTNFISSIKLQ